jgi:hypothetical protein
MGFTDLRKMNNVCFVLSRFVQSVKKCVNVHRRDIIEKSEKIYILKHSKHEPTTTNQFA